MNPGAVTMRPRGRPRSRDALWAVLCRALGEDPRIGGKAAWRWLAARVGNDVGGVRLLDISDARLEWIAGGRLHRSGYRSIENRLAILRGQVSRKTI